MTGACKFTSAMAGVVCPDVLAGSAYCFQDQSDFATLAWLVTSLPTVYHKLLSESYLSRYFVTGGPFSPWFCWSRLCCLFSVIIPPTDLSIISCIRLIVSSLDLSSSFCFSFSFSISLSLSMMTFLSLSISDKRESTFPESDEFPFCVGFLMRSRSDGLKLTPSL